MKTQRAKKPLTAAQKSKLLKAADEARERVSKRSATRGSLQDVGSGLL